MAVRGIGIDIIQIDRVVKLRRDFGDKFLERIFTPAEVETCMKSKRPDEMLAGRFAAKEAVMKAIGAGLYEGVMFRDIEIVGGRMAKPDIRLHGKAKEYADKVSANKVHISMTHDNGFAAAVAVIED